MASVVYCKAILLDSKRFRRRGELSSSKLSVWLTEIGKWAFEGTHLSVVRSKK
jgi:hypothetical protein